MGNFRGLRVLGLMLALLLLVACSSGGQIGAKEGSGSGPAVGQPTAGAKVLRVATNLDLASPDLHLSTNYNDRLPLLNVLDFLIGLDESGAPAPVLAENWEWSADDLTLTVNLRKGVKFHNGQEMTSADVKYSLDRVRTEGPRSSEFAVVADIEAADPYTVKLHLTEPSAALLGALANPIAPAVIVPEGEAERQGGKITKPVGTGPFMFVEWAPDQHLKLAKFPDYAVDERPASGFAGKRLALVDEVLFLPIQEASVRADALAKGEVHIADEIAYQDYVRLQDNADIVIDVVPSATIGDARMGFKQGPFADDVKLRQAVLYGTDREEMMEALTWGLSRVANAGVPYFSDYYGPVHQQLVPYDPDKARQLVQESSYDGREIVLSYTPGIYKEMAVVMQAQLAEIGINATLDNLDAASASQTWSTGTFDIFVSGLTLRPDPMNYYMPFWHSGSTPTGYNNPEYDRLNEEAARVTDVAKRKQLYGQIEQLLRDDVPWFPLIHRIQTQGYTKNVSGFEVWSAGYCRVWNVDISG